MDHLVVFKNFINQISPIQEATFEALQQSFRPIQLKKNDFFVREGEYAQQIGFLKKGIIRAFFMNEDGKEYSKQFFVAPALVGAYTSLLTKKANKIPQQALTDCEILVANYAQIESYYDQYHDLERLGRKIAEYYFLEKEEKELEMGLLEAQERYLLMRERFPTIESQIPQYHIASYLGISPTQLSRIRRGLKG